MRLPRYEAGEVDPGAKGWAGGLKRKANAILLCEQKRCLAYSIWKDISILHMMKDQLLGYFVFRR
jgi:hypothetical protein